MNLRELAKCRECQIRIPGICKNDRSTVVLCHLHKPSISGGMGLKADDILGAHGCNLCHDVVDGRNLNGDQHGLTRDQIEIGFYLAIFKTQKILLDEGKIGVIP